MNDTQTVPSLPQRTLRTTTLLAGFFMLLFALRGDLTVTFGLGVGAALGLFSLWTLVWAIPALFHPGNPMARGLLGLLTLTKLPIYVLVLNFAMTSDYVNPLAVFVGVAFIPVVLVMKAAGGHLLEQASAVSGGEACHSEPRTSN